MHDLIIKLLDEVRGSWRYRWWALGAAWAVCALGWAFVISMPDVFQATARVYVDSQSALRPLLRGLAVEPDVQSNLLMVRQAILSRPHLEKVARETDLDLRAHTPEQMERLVDSLGKRIVIEADLQSRSAGSDGVYNISFNDYSRAKSLEVVQSLLDSFVEDTLGSKRTGQEDAQRFLEKQIADYEKRLSAAETRVSEFKKRNVGKMPDDRGDYFARMQSEMSGLDQVFRELNLAETRRLEIKRQLSGEDPFLFGLESSSSNNSAGQGSGDVAVRLRDLEKRLEDLLLRYTDKHPEVVAVRSTIEQLKVQQAEELSRLRRGQKGTGSLAQSLKVNPVYQSIQIELKTTEVRIAELRQDLAQRQARVESLRRLVNTVPEVEAELARVNRDYEVTHAQYQQLLQRLETAKLSEEADRTGVVKFEVIDPPAAPISPVAPNRMLLLAGVLLLAVAAGGGLAYLLNMLRPVFHNARALADITGLPVLGTVRRTWLLKHQSEARSQTLAFSAGLALLIVIFVGILFLHDGIRSVAGLAG